MVRLEEVEDEEFIRTSEKGFEEDDEEYTDTGNTRGRQTGSQTVPSL